MLFHVYADRASAGLIKAIAVNHFPNDPIFDRSMASDDSRGESERLLHGFAAFVKNVLEQKTERVFVFDLFDRIDRAKGEELAKAFEPLFAAGVEIHAAAECGENDAVSAVLAAAECAGYHTVITKSQTEGEKHELS